MFAVATLRSLKRRSGIRGESTRDSTTRNVASSAPEMPSSTSVCAEVHPASFPFTIA